MSGVVCCAGGSGWSGAVCCAAKGEASIPNAKAAQMRTARLIIGFMFPLGSLCVTHKSRAPGVDPSSAESMHDLSHGLRWSN